VYRPRPELQKAAPRNFAAFFAEEGANKDNKIPAVPRREGRRAFAIQDFSRAIFFLQVAIKRQ
jgi:hypothetical protein